MNGNKIHKSLSAKPPNCSRKILFFLIQPILVTILCNHINRLCQINMKYRHLKHLSNKQSNDNCCKVASEEAKPLPNACSSLVF